MRNVIEAMLVLQERDERVGQLEADLGRIPRELSSLEEGWQAIRTAAELRKQGYVAAELERKKLHLEADSLREKIARYQTQQQATRKNEEYQALQHEINHGNKKIATIEDTELELMERIVVLEKEVAIGEQELAANEGQWKAKGVELEAKKTTIEKLLVAARAEQAAGEATLEEDVLRRYRRILVSKKGKAVVPLNLGTCTGCHMRLPAQTCIRAKAFQEIVTCDNCGRIIYWWD
jgi:uncharacterized protein